MHFFKMKLVLNSIHSLPPPSPKGPPAGGNMPSLPVELGSNSKAACYLSIAWLHSECVSLLPRHPLAVLGFSQLVSSPVNRIGTSWSADESFLCGWVDLSGGPNGNQITTAKNRLVGSQPVDGFLSIDKQTDSDLCAPPTLRRINCFPYTLYMCGRYRLSRRKQILEEHFAADWNEADWSPRYNIAPTQLVPVVRQEPKSASREISLIRWGLVPSWAKDPSKAAAMINARAETVANKPAFGDALKFRRCLIPADGFYEWQRLAN
jgi:hypothetical protein